MHSETAWLLTLLGAATLGVAIAACGNSTAPTDAEVFEPCKPMSVAECPSPAPTYADVSAIITKRCVVCHDGKTGQQWPLTTYKSIKDWEDHVRDLVGDCSMPPADGGVPITTADRRAILTWVTCGLPQ